MSRHRLRVCVVDPTATTAAYPRLDECDVDVIGVVPLLQDALHAPTDDVDAFVVGATAAQLRDARFRARLARLARRIPTALVVRRATRLATIVFANVRAAALVERTSPPSTLAEALHRVHRGEVVWPKRVSAQILRLVPPLAT